MAPVVLRCESVKGEPLEVVYSPEEGMTLLSFKWAGVELLDESTRPQFAKRRAGLGPLIGPHFYRRKIVEGALGKEDPFSHGIGRYAAWNYTRIDNRIEATLSGRDLLEGRSLSLLEGQDFKMHYTAELTPRGLELALSVVGESDAVVGIHFYYKIPRGGGKVSSSVAENYMPYHKPPMAIPRKWLPKPNFLEFDLTEDADFTFHPHPDPLHGQIALDLIDYTLSTRYWSPSSENSWQLWHPKGSSFVCVEPLSAKNPLHPVLSTNSLVIHLSAAMNPH